MTEERATTVIDARGLPPPEPLQLALAALETLAPGSELLLRLDREPFPLYELLDRGGWSHHATVCPDGAFEIRIGRAAAG